MTMPSVASSAAPFFRKFFVASIAESSLGRQSKHEPLVLFSYTPPSIPETTFRDLLDFCFPDLLVLQAQTSFASDTIWFGLTAQDSSKVNGFCRRYIPAGSSSKTPHALCILSDHAWLGIFTQVLDVAQSRMQLSAASVVEWLHAVFSTPLPSPGEAFHLSLDGMRHTIERPRDDFAPCSDSQFKPLFDKLSPANILLLFQALLFERRLILLSPHTHELGAAVHAALALIQPFEWQHMVVPILPDKLLSYLTAPFPFLVGVHSQHRADIQKMPTEEVVVVDLEHDELKYQPDQLAHSPLRHFHAMQYAIRSLSCTLGNFEAETYCMACIILEFQLAMLGDCIMFLRDRLLRPSRDLGAAFDPEAFEAAMDEFCKTQPADHQFLQVLKQSQSFVEFVMQTNTDRKQSLFEYACSKRQSSVAVHVPAYFQNNIRSFSQSLLTDYLMDSNKLVSEPILSELSTITMSATNSWVRATAASQARPSSCRAERHYTLRGHSLFDHALVDKLDGATQDGTRAESEWHYCLEQLGIATEQVDNELSNVWALSNNIAKGAQVATLDFKDL